MNYLGFTNDKLYADGIELLYLRSMIGCQKWDCGIVLYEYAYSLRSQSDLILFLLLL